MNDAAFTLAGHRVTRAQFYQVACDPQRNVVVEACAGAGKTWMLVSRVLRALLDGAQPQHILAVTFTRKAAGEMRERLDQWLAEFADTQCTHAQRVVELCQRGLSATQADALAATLGRLQRELHGAGHGVQVHTFHSWFAQLVMNAPFSTLEQLGLPQRFTLVEDTSILSTALYRRFYQRVLADVELRADHAQLIARHRRFTVQQWFDRSLQRGTEVLCADEAGTLMASLPPASALDSRCLGLDHPGELLREGPLREQLLTLAKRLGSAKKKKPQKAASGLLEALECDDPLVAVNLAYNALFTAKRGPLALGEFDGLDGAREAIAEVEALARQEQAHVDHGRVVRLVRVLLSEFAALKIERGLVDMNDLERAARLMLANEAVSGWVHEKLDLRVRHVLVDEFQDTSPLQWHALHAWLSGYVGAGGGASGQRPPSVFIVGDPKQSIYRFRGAEPRVFAAAKDFVVQGLEGAVLACDHTRRCSMQVLDQVNAVFSSAHLLGQWPDFRVHTTESDVAGAVQALHAAQRAPDKLGKDEPAAPWRPSLTQARFVPETHLREHEIQQVVAAIVELLTARHYAPKDIMVLSRKRAMLAEVATALAGAGVAHVMPEALAVTESPEAMDLVALLDVLASPGHDLSLARALKSPLFGASDDDLLWLSSAAAKLQETWLAALLAAGPSPSTSPLTQALVRARMLLQAWLPLVHRLAPHELIDRVVHDSDLLARMAAVVPRARWSAAQAGLNAVVGAAITHNAGRFSTLYSLVRGIFSGELKVPASAPANAVQLLTVHGAKGLEARAVLVVDSDAREPKTETGMVVCDWPVESAAPRRLAFLAKEALPPPSLVALLQAEHAAQEREELNALYVAMTRASEHLVFSSTPPYAAAKSATWWDRLILHVSPEVEKSLSGLTDAWGKDGQIFKGPDYAGPRAPRSMSDGADGSPTIDEDKARLGLAVHRVLEWAGQSSTPASSQRLASLASQATRAFGLPAAATSEVLQAASDVLNSPACRPFFHGPDLMWAGTEVALAGPAGVLRLDRLVKLRQNGQIQWWVLDFKLHAAPAQVSVYRQQLRQYQMALQALVPDDKVLAAFIAAQGALIPL